MQFNVIKIKVILIKAIMFTKQDIYIFLNRKSYYKNLKKIKNSKYIKNNNCIQLKFLKLKNSKTKKLIKLFFRKRNLTSGRRF